jgi:hypothetical protein
MVSLGNVNGEWGRVNEGDAAKFKNNVFEAYKSGKLSPEMVRKIWLGMNVELIR